MIYLNGQILVQLQFLVGIFLNKNQIEIYKTFEIIKYLGDQVSMHQDQDSLKYRNSISSTQASFGLGSLKVCEVYDSNKDVQICRICLEEAKTKDNKNEVFIRACRCSGSLQFVHHDCILEWINTVIQKKIELGHIFNQVSCQICQDRFDLRTDKKLACRKKAEIKYRMKVHWLVLLLNLTFIVATLGVLGFLGWYQTVVHEDIKKQIIAGWVVLGMCLVFWIANLIKIFVVYNKTYVAQVKSRKLAPPPVDSAHNTLKRAQFGDKPQIFINVRPRKKMIHLQERKNQSGQCFGQQPNNHNLNLEVFRTSIL